MRRIPADRIVAEYLAQAAAASRGMLPAQREEFLDRLHDEVRERVGVGPRRDVAAVTAALAELGAPTDLVAAERDRLAAGPGVATRDVRRLAARRAPGAVPPIPDLPPVPDVLPLLEAPSAPDGLSAAVVRQRTTAELPTEPLAGHLRPAARPAAAPPKPRRRAVLRGVRWEIATVTMFLAGPLFLGLLALLVGSAMVARSTFWDVRDKIRALIGIPAAGVLFVVVRAWLDATHFNELQTSGARLRAAGESLAGTGGYVVPVLGLLIAARLGWLVLRDVPRDETERHAARSAG
ncbi:MAG: hypothetical protein ACT4QG_19440 [Sporichthyaceae bacterium]